MNTGVRDATNVAWKLAAAATGRAAPSILDTYEQERLPHARAMVELSTTLGRILSPTKTAVARLRDCAFRLAQYAPGFKEWVLQMRFKPMPPYQQGVLVPAEGSAVVGRPFIQPSVETEDGQRVLLDDACGAGFALIGHYADPLYHMTAASRHVLDQLGTRYLTVVESRAGAPWHAADSHDPATVVIEDLENRLRPWFTAAGAPFVLLRPDRYVAAISDVADLDSTITTFATLMGMPNCETRARSGAA